MRQIVIYRRDFSSYFGPNFKAQEEAALNHVLTKSSEEFELTYTNIAPKSGESIILTNSQTYFEEFDQELLDRTSLIIHANSGYDNISTDFVLRTHFPIVVGNQLRAQAVASYVLACLFDHTTCPPFGTSWDKARQWPRQLIAELNILLLGHGHIGEIVSQVLGALGAKIQTLDPYQGQTKVDISAADVIIPLASLNPTSKHLINKSFLSQVKENVLIINGSRGAIIDQKALTTFLENHPSAMAYLDVFEEEPTNFEAFSRLKNVKCTSHIAGVYTNLDQCLINYEAQVLSDFINTPNTFKSKYARAILSNKIHQDFLI